MRQKHSHAPVSVRLSIERTWYGAPNDIQRTGGGAPEFFFSEPFTTCGVKRVVRWLHYMPWDVYLSQRTAILPPYIVVDAVFQKAAPLTQDKYGKPCAEKNSRPGVVILVNAPHLHYLAGSMVRPGKRPHRSL